MPKIYEYNGFKFHFYSNDHNPPHCHVKKAEKICRIKFDNIGGAISVSILDIKTNKNFSDNEKSIIDDFVRLYCNGILEKWDIFFIQKKKPKSEKINRV